MIDWSVVCSVLVALGIYRAIKLLSALWSVVLKMFNNAKGNQND